MKIHADWVFSYFGGVMAILAYFLWVYHQGMDPVAVVVVGAFTLVVVTVAILLSLDKWERNRAKQLEESSRGFPWRSFAKGNGLNIGFMGLFAASGWDKASLEFGAVLLFGVANAGAVIQWLMLRRSARNAGRDSRNPTV